jgi:signal transduction histidine kinase
MDDITEEVKIKETLIAQKNELIQLNDLKDKYFSIISHDLKGPIFGVKELIHLTQTGLISKEEFFELLPEVSKNMENVAQLLENLLAWTSSQIRGEQLVLEDFDIYRILSQQKQLLERLSKEKNIKITLEGNPEVQKVRGDKNMVELVIRNLINNAIKFSNQNGEVIISTSLSNECVKICIEDFGKGISPENLEKINKGISFTTKGSKSETGTGLGLVLVREYVRKNSGRLEVTSIVDNGAKFCIYLKEAKVILCQTT